MSGRLSLPERIGLAAAAVVSLRFLATGEGFRLLLPILAAYPLAAVFTWLFVRRARPRPAVLGLRRGLAVAAVTFVVTLPLSVLPWYLTTAFGLPGVPYGLVLYSHVYLVGPVLLLFVLGAAEPGRGRAIAALLLAVTLLAVLGYRLTATWWTTTQFVFRDLVEATVFFVVATVLGLPMVPLARHLPAMLQEALHEGEAADGEDGAAE